MTKPISDSSPGLTRNEAQAGCWLAVLAKRTGWPISVTSLARSTHVSVRRGRPGCSLSSGHVSIGGVIASGSSVSKASSTRVLLAEIVTQAPGRPRKVRHQTRKSPRSDGKHSMAPPVPHGSRRNEPTQCRSRGAKLHRNSAKHTTPAPSNRQTALVQIELRFRISRLIFVGH